MGRWFSRLPAAFAVLLWFGAAFYFLGDLGRYSDDYHAHVRNLGTGELDWSRQPWNRWSYFWRPLHLAHVHVVNTVSYRHAWIGHAELAVVHGLVAWMLARFLRRAGVRRSIALLSALVFMTLPLTAEAAMWTSASCNAISSLVLMWALGAAWRDGASTDGRSRGIRFALLAFFAACWYEPAAGAMIAAPLVFLAATPAGTRLRSRLRSAMVQLAAIAGAGLLYAALLVLTAPPNVRGGTGSLVAPEGALDRSIQIVRLTMHSVVGLRGRNAIVGSVEQGWGVLTRGPGPALLAGAAVLGVATICVIAARAGRSSAGQPSNCGRRALLIVAGAAAAIGGLLPLFVLNRNGVELRTLYIPLLGLTIAAAVAASRLADGLARATRSARRTLGALGASLVVAGTVAGMIGMVGFQAQFRRVYQNDQRIAANLRTLVPDPPAGTMFVPLRIKTRGAATSRAGYNHALHSALEAPWCSSHMLRRAYGRNDVACTCIPYWTAARVPFVAMDAGGAASNGISLGAEIGRDGLAHVRWDACIPFVVEPDGTVRLVERATVHPAAGDAFDVTFPRAAGRHPALTAGLWMTPSRDVAVRIMGAAELGPPEIHAEPRP